ncbi:hypothetical protein JTE90_000879 [Oedothorax gibbosus]|uniref:Uncharacterized protein n=1 Tax=Oedothorax gibbosus TaxID=931172 RepID=A0AAV6VVG3_9ARAC|nr:hypothetical protein JTE90_000879 [Oedothorax gibbosus]
MGQNAGTSTSEGRAAASGCNPSPTGRKWEQNAGTSTSESRAAAFSATLLQPAVMGPNAGTSPSESRAATFIATLLQPAVMGTKCRLFHLRESRLSF